MMVLGRLIHKHWVRHHGKIQTHWTRFLRNKPQQEVLADLLAQQQSDVAKRVLSLGCSSGAELYSFLYVARSRHPALRLTACGVDISPAVIEIASAATYPKESGSALDQAHEAGDPVIAELPSEMISEIFVEHDGKLVVRDWIRADTSWLVGSILNTVFLKSLGQFDAILVNNVLGPMPDSDAEACVRQLIDEVLAPGGYLVVEGMDMDLRTTVFSQSALTPVADRLEEIHLADHWKQGWPWLRWSHEPIDKHFNDWQIRYGTIFSAPRDANPATKRSLVA
jgi:chemotaxis methyl-accepting protein methylase